MIVDKLKELY